MSLIGPANPTVRTDVDVALDADLSDPPESWDWTTLGDYTDGSRTRRRVLNQTIGIAHGRRDESNLSDPSTVDVVLGNGDGALTPRNASSPLSPGLVRGTPLRVMVAAGSSYLAVTGVAGSNATTPDAASWNIGANLAVAVQFRAPVRFPVPGDTYEVFGQSLNAGDERSWLTFISTSGTLGLRVSSDGIAESESQSSLIVPSPDAGPLTVAWVFDGDNGAFGNTTTFYVVRETIDDLLADPDAFVFGDPEINLGTLTLHNSTGTVGVGDVPGAGFSPYPGAIDRVYVRAGTLTSGTVVADADFTAQPSGTTSFADDADTPKTWTINNAEITDRHPRFTGRTDKVTATWGELDEDNPLLPTVAYVAVSASGVLEGLAQSDEPLRSALFRAVTAPVASTLVRDYYPLEDGRDATEFSHPVGGAPGGIVGMSLASDDTLDASEALPSVSGSQPFGWNLVLSGDADTQTWEFTMLVNIPVAPASASSEFLDLCRIDTKGGVTSQWVLRIDDANWRVFAKDLDGTNILSASGASDELMFGTWMIVTLSIDVVGINITWDLDLTPIPLGATFGSNGTLVSLGLPAGRPVRLRNLSSSAPQEGFSAGHFIITQGAPTGWLAPADTAYVGEPAPVRVHRLCREYGIRVAVDGPIVGSSSPSWAPAIAAGAQPMGPQRPDKLLSLLEECAVTDHGVLGEQRGALGLTYRSGVTLLNQPVGLQLERARRQVIDPFEAVDDDQRLVNDVTASRPGGSSYRVTDPAIAAGTVERHERSVEVNVPDDRWLPHQAGWRWHLGTWEEPRFPAVWSDVAKTADLVDDVLGFSVGDRLTVPDPPPGCPAVDQLADGLVEELERFQWRVGVNGRPAGPWTVGVLDDDTPTLTLARLTSGGSTLAGDLSATATGAVSVDVTGPLWTTAAAYFPLNVEVDGEVITLSAVSGGSSPQTFTISARSVNGVVNTHAAGAGVEVAVPFRLAM